MKRVTPFVISEFTNPSGEIVYLLHARNDGQRIRKNFAPFAEARAEREILEVNWLQRDSGTRAAITRITEDQLHEAEALFRRLGGQPRSLSFYVDFALTNYREPVARNLLTETLAEFLVIKDHEHEQDLLSEPYLTRVKRDLNHSAHKWHSGQFRSTIQRQRNYWKTLPSGDRPTTVRADAYVAAHAVGATRILSA